MLWLLSRTLRRIPNHWVVWQSSIEYWIHIHFSVIHHTRRLFMWLTHWHISVLLYSNIVLNGLLNGCISGEAGGQCVWPCSWSCILIKVDCSTRLTCGAVHVVPRGGISCISCSTSLSASLHPAFDNNVDITMCVTAAGIVAHTLHTSHSHYPGEVRAAWQRREAVASCSEPTPGGPPARLPGCQSGARVPWQLGEGGSFGVRKRKGEEGGGGADQQLTHWNQ